MEVKTSRQALDSIYSVKNKDKNCEIHNFCHIHFIDVVNPQDLKWETNSVINAFRSLSFIRF